MPETPPASDIPAAPQVADTQLPELSFDAIRAYMDAHPDERYMAHFDSPPVPEPVQALLQGSAPSQLTGVLVQLPRVVGAMKVNNADIPDGNGVALRIDQTSERARLHMNSLLTALKEALRPPKKPNAFVQFQRWITGEDRQLRETNDSLSTTFIDMVYTLNFLSMRIRSDMLVAALNKEEPRTITAKMEKWQQSMEDFIASCAEEEAALGHTNGTAGTYFEQGAGI